MGSELRDITVNDVLVPSAGEHVEQCRLAQWHVAEGARVEYGEVLASLETESIETEILAKFTGEISQLVAEKEVVSIGAKIAEIRSNEDDRRQNENKKSAVILPPAQPEKANSSQALIKLVILIVVAFIAVKYGVPLMNQISEESAEKLGAEGKQMSETAQLKHPRDEVIAASPIKPTIRITKGYEGWEAGVREQLEAWINEEDAAHYVLISIEVNDARDTMEIRYKTDQETHQRQKLSLRKDGFGERFIYTESGKEFLVYPPE